MRVPPMDATWIRGRCLGRGSFGTVHLAFHSFKPHVFAVKSVDTTSSLPTQLDSLENEIHILRSLPPSPYVVHYLGDDVSKDTSSTSFRNLHLEYLPGGTVVDAAVRRGSRFSEADELIVRSQVRGSVNALRHVHSNGIVHCDVKGRNILLGSDHSVAKLVDFGSAIRMEDIERPGIMPRGSPLWMAPEVVRGVSLGPKSDVWSLGCTVIEIVTGKPAWEDEGVDTLRQIGYSSELPKFPSRLSELGRDFLEKCLRRDYADRWSCDQLLCHPFLATGSSDSIAPTGLGCSPRCVLDWPDSDFEDEDKEASTSEVENHEAAARGAIGKLSTSEGPSWELEGSDWMVARDWASDEYDGGEEGRSGGTSDWLGAEMGVGGGDRGEVGRSWRSWGVGETEETSNSMLDGCSLLEIFSHSNLLVSNYYWFVAKLCCRIIQFGG